MAGDSAPGIDSRMQKCLLSACDAKTRKALLPVISAQARQAVLSALENLIQVLEESLAVLGGAPADSEGIEAEKFRVGE